VVVFTNNSLTTEAQRHREEEPGSDGIDEQEQAQQDRDDFNLQ